MRQISAPWANNFNARRSSVVIALTSKVSFDKVAHPINDDRSKVIELGYDADGNYLFRLEFENSFDPGNDEVDFNIGNLHSWNIFSSFFCLVLKDFNS